MKHLAKLVDATHILSSVYITKSDLKVAHNLLVSFVEEFEILYGKEHMVYNVHQLLHITECVKLNGSLFAYSNYANEDYIGHLVNFVQGTTDVTTQVCSRYILEKNLYVHLQKSALAQSYFDQIESKLSFPIAEKVDGSLVIGNSKLTSGFNEQELLMIRNTLEVTEETEIDEYKSIFLNCKAFYETYENNLNKRTDDSIILNTENNRFALIKSIIRVNQQLYFFIVEKFKTLNDTDCKKVKFLDEKESYTQKLISSALIGEKHAFVKFEKTIAISKFPNLHEKN